MHTTQSPSAIPGLPDVYFTPPSAIDALQAIGSDATAAESAQPFDFVVGNPPFGAGQSASA